MRNAIFGEHHTQPMADEEVGWGLAACGGAGKTFIEVCESLGGIEKWQLTFEFPSIQMWMEIQGPSTIMELFDFFNKTYGSQATQWMTLGLYFGQPVTVAKDEEFADRYFIWVRGKDSYAGWSDNLRISLFGEGTTDFMTALSQVVDDLKS